MAELMQILGFVEQVVNVSATVLSKASQYTGTVGSIKTGIGKIREIKQSSGEVFEIVKGIGNNGLAQHSVGTQGTYHRENERSSRGRAVHSQRGR